MGNGVFAEKTEKVRNSKKMVRYSRILMNFFRGFGNVNFPNFPKPSKKLCTIRSSEIRKYSFRLGNRPESSAKSSECRALVYISGFCMRFPHCIAITYLD